MVDYNNCPGSQTFYQNEYDSKQLNENNNVKNFVR